MVEADDIVAMPRDDYETLLEQAAYRGVKKAFDELGIDTENRETVEDFRDGLALVRSLKKARASALQTAWQTIIRVGTVAAVIAILAYFGVRISKLPGSGL